MTIKMASVSPMLLTRNIDATIAFYTQVLGFELENRMPADDGEWCALACGEAGIMFYTAPGGASPKMTGQVYFNPDDVRALWEKIKDHVSVAWELEEMDYGMLEFAIEDPNGYTITFGQEV